MEKLSRKELLEHIKNQDTENTKYRTRFRDLVEAYKGLQTEKSALENILKALKSESFATGCLPNKTDSPNAETGFDETAQSVTQIDKQILQSEESDGDKINALRNALVTLTEEKNRNDSNLLRDKRMLKQALEDLKGEFQEKLSEFEKEKSALQKTIQELRSDVRKEQQQREGDHAQQTLMMRELQTKLIAERASREKFEQQYEALLLQQKTGNVGQQQRSAEEYERILEDLTKEMSKLKKMNQEAMEKARRPNPMLLKLQSEMQDIKVKHQEAVTDEQRQSNHAKAELRSLALSSETRITSLEAKVAELSQMIGNYDKLRTQDQNSIQKLKEHIAQLDLEKRLLLQQQTPAPRSRVTSSDEELQEDSNLDVHALAEKITKLKNLLNLANNRSEKPFEAHVLLELQESSVYESGVHSRCKEELEQLKEEFERYKSRSQSVLKNRTTEDQENHGEVKNLRNLVSELKSQLQFCRVQCDQKIKASDERFETVQHEHRQEMRQLRAQLELDHSTKVLEMEQQMQKQRERTLALLDEKEKDLAHKERQIASLRTGLTFAPSQDRFLNHISDSQKDEEMPLSVNTEEGLPEMLSQAMSSSNGDHLILHYVQDLARKDLEISNLRRSRHQAETALRELQRDSQSKEERYKDDLEAMQSKIFRLESSQSEEGVNMEYLKNVVLRYILCKDIEGKRRILNAIATVLHFTVRELEQARMGM